ncbi:MAG: ABC transporter ATP-binding protein [Candidatus Dormibacteria bacterium]
MTAELLTVDSIDVAYGQVPALRGVSLSVGKGEIVALVGSNGAGKTTTMRTISGLLAPSAGSITFAGEPIAGLPAHLVVRRGITHLPEGRDLFASLSVLDNLAMGYWVKRSDRQGMGPALERAMEMFPILRSRSGQAAGTLSGGEQQMLGVARALMSSPSLLIVDELSLGLAPLIVQQLFEVLAAVNAQGTSVLLVEQHVHMALENSHRAYVLAKGEVVAHGPSRELLSDPALVHTYFGGAAPVEAGAE